MSLIKCNKCGEVYSDSYKKCPFCVEDEEYYNGKVKKRGHRQMEKRKKAPSAVGPVLVLAVLVLAGILVWAFAGDTVRGWFGGDKQPEDVDPGTTQNQPVNTPVDNEPVVKALNKASGHVRTEVSRRMHIRKAPRFVFVKDEGAAYAAHINKLLGELDIEPDSDAE